MKIGCSNNFVQWARQLWRQFRLFIQPLGFSVIIQSLARKEIVDDRHTVVLTFLIEKQEICYFVIQNMTFSNFVLIRVRCSHEVKYEPTSLIFRESQ